MGDMAGSAQKGGLTILTEDDLWTKGALEFPRGNGGRGNSELINHVRAAERPVIVAFPVTSTQRGTENIPYVCVTRKMLSALTEGRDVLFTDNFILGERASEAQGGGAEGWDKKRHFKTNDFTPNDTRDSIPVMGICGHRYAKWEREVLVIPLYNWIIAVKSGVLQNPRKSFDYSVDIKKYVEQVDIVGGEGTSSLSGVYNDVATLNTLKNLFNWRGDSKKEGKYVAAFNIGKRNFYVAGFGIGTSSQSIVYDVDRSPSVQTLYLKTEEESGEAPKVVQSPKRLSEIIRDALQCGGAFRPHVLCTAASQRANYPREPVAAVWENTPV